MTTYGARPEQLKCLGNGVVPQQAAAATAAWVADTLSERAASVVAFLQAEHFRTCRDVEIDQKSGGV